MARKKLKVSCKNCSVSFLAQKKSRKFCSQKCGDQYRHRVGYQKKKSVVGHEAACSLKGCENKVWLYPRHIKKGANKFCSRTCDHKFKMKNSPLECPMCEKSFYVSKSQQRLRNRETCSNKCRGKLATFIAAKRNRLNPPTQGVLNRRIRYSKRMDDWRVAVFERDDYTCQECRVRGGNLNADHIKPFAFYPELRFDLSNGRTLCRACHMKTPTWGRKAMELNHG